MKNLAIICGGYSEEYDISIKSGRNILSSFPKEYKGYLVIHTKNQWQVEVEDKLIPFDASSFSFQWNGSIIKIDLALVYIHGDPGENGKVQAYLDMIDVPYLNSGPLASMLSFDKWYCNQFLKGFGVKVADSVYLANKKQSYVPEGVVQLLGLPVFVKPCDGGSSFGISKVNTIDELKPAVENAFLSGKTVVIERNMPGTEVTCGVFRNENGIVALPVTEIVTENEFFDYEAKYQGKSQEITPARISEEATKKVQEIAVKVYELLQLRSIARVDFMLIDDAPHVIEVNTTPGFSNESIVPKMLATAGISSTEMFEQILKAEIN